jgi:hypothetical protein
MWTALQQYLLPNDMDCWHLFFCWTKYTVAILKENYYSTVINNLLEETEQ